MLRLIGANGAGKSTFLKILSGEIEPQEGHVSVGKDERIAVLKQDHYAYEDEKVLDVVIMGHTRLHEIIQEKDEIYAKVSSQKKTACVLLNSKVSLQS